MKPIDSENVIAWLNAQIEKVRGGWLHDYGFPTNVIAELTDVKRFVKNLPTIEPEVRHGRWIPCREKMPEQGERVIVAIFGSDMIMPNEGETLQDAIERSRKEGYITVGFIGSDGWYGADLFPLMVQPSYWMPKPDLPEPPKE